MSVVDMFLPKPYDGVVPDPYSRGGIAVRDLVPGGAADVAGIRPGDLILGIGHRMLRGPADAPAELLRYQVGQEVTYLVKRGDKVFEAAVRMSSYRAGSLSYFYFVLLGAAFFALGSFVLSKGPDDPAVAVFYLLSVLFMLFFVCRLRPLSYYWIDYFVQLAGTLALFLLPAVFLHFFLLFPRRKVFRFVDPEKVGPEQGGLLLQVQKFLNGSPALLTLLYTMPPAVYLLQMSTVVGSGQPARLIYGAPVLNWILLADYLVLGILALFHSWWTAEDRKERRQTLFLLLGTLSGTIPFVIFAVSFPSFFRNDRYLAWGVVPMALIPLTFAYAIVRFRLFDVKFLVRKSIVYGFLTAVVTGIYALAIVTGSRLATASPFFSSPLFAFIFGLLVVVVIDPLRRRLQSAVDRVFFRDRTDFQKAILDVSREVVSKLERDKLHELLTVKTAQLLKLERLDLFTPRPEDGSLALAEPDSPEEAILPIGSTLARLVIEKNGPLRVAELNPAHMDLRSRRFLEAISEKGIRVLVPVATRGRLLGLLAAGEKKSEEEWTREDLDHLAMIANQGALGLEAANLHEELTRQAEVQRDLEIARDIQTSLFPQKMPNLPGVEFFGVSRPAKVVGGDFFDFIEFDGTARSGLVLGDVSGKSIPASFLMVAAKEIVYARAMTNPDPAVVFKESNRRVYAIKRRMFVSLAYFLIDAESLSMQYSIGGQPVPLLLRKGEKTAVEIPVPTVRLPLGAFKETDYDSKLVYLKRGDLLLFYTDGLSEAMSVAGEFYGDENLGESLVRNAYRPLPDLAQALLDEIKAFTGTADQYDDQTFILMRVGGG
jgi:sigma-B regulation protein RsbU (phosphoserine phosphatase)